MSELFYNEEKRKKEKKSEMEKKRRPNKYENGINLSIIWIGKTLFWGKNLT